ncbi:MAG: hypothetical protein ACKVPX_05990 [Myxococcaceae bacterium]
MHFFLGGRTQESANAQSEDVLSDKSVVTRRVFLKEKRPLLRWSHACTFIRVDSEIRDSDGKLVRQKTADGKWVDVVTRYFLSSLPRAAMTDAQWLLVVRRHWAVENNVHGTLDLAFKEDDAPWIEASPQGALAVLLLRRVALNLLGLFRSVTQRSDEKRATPWKQLMRGVYLALVTATEEVLAGIRHRTAIAS